MSRKLKPVSPGEMLVEESLKPLGIPDAHRSTADIHDTEQLHSSPGSLAAIQFERRQRAEHKRRGATAP